MGGFADIDESISIRRYTMNVRYATRDVSSSQSPISQKIPTLFLLDRSVQHERIDIFRCFLIDNYICASFD